MRRRSTRVTSHVVPFAQQERTVTGICTVSKRKLCCLASSSMSRWMRGSLCPVKPMNRSLPAFCASRHASMAHPAAKGHGPSPPDGSIRRPESTPPAPCTCPRSAANQARPRARLARLRTVCLRARRADDRGEAQTVPALSGPAICRIRHCQRQRHRRGGRAIQGGYRFHSGS